MGGQMTPGGPEVSGSVGEGIRRRREAAGLTLRGLARAVGVSPSLISQIERGLSAPSVGTLYSIATTLRISMDDLFPDQRNAVLRASERPRLTLATGVRWERLTASRDPRLEFLFTVYPAGSESCPAEAPVRHTGSEYGLVIEGRLGATVGERAYELEPGDAIAFDSKTPHRLWAIGAEAASAVWIVIGREDDPRLD